MLEHNLTRHAETRMRQRGFQSKDVELILDAATQMKSNVFLLTKADAQREIQRRRREIQAIERLAGSTMVIAGDQVVTMYHTNRKKEKRFMRAQR